MINVSGLGLQLSLIASKTFPGVGVPISSFAEDADAIVFENIEVNKVAVGSNGDAIGWSVPVLYKVTINIIAGSTDDDHLSMLVTSEAANKNKQSAYNNITLVGTYPSDLTKTFTLSNGKITDGTFATSMTQDSKFKTKEFKFVFENFSGIS